MPSVSPPSNRTVPRRQFLNMSLLLASAAVTAAAMVPACSWNMPGRHPYRGTATEAVSRYVDIPAATRHRLAAKIDAGNADDDVVITRDAIEGRASYAPAISAMHFGRQTVCERVTRERWPASAREPAKVYCADGHCLIVPRICNNISRIRVAGGGAGSGIAGPAKVTSPQVARPGSIPEPAGAPEVDIEAADAMAQLAASAPVAPPPSLPATAFGNWTPGPGPAVGGLPGDIAPMPVSAIPEPAGWMMFFAGVAGVLVYSRFRR
ncbi:MHFG family PEP-CTERM protein [Pseudoduganella lutea]|uniref:Uncharacterized protein n=1 Tax=Pseudoduganella lutea TaxID=321985 RepID=A0A4P6L703_9BURK|nr:MHFG family PEP-CTERM protein [Pseudoduganella lutea]QBE66738.1 hypothetical protein EWM63_30335 [Pseudoduganella lutea]